MLIAIVGGNLQGVEAAYLARKAGWKVKVLDKNVQAPACGMSDSFIQIDVIAEKDLYEALDDVDFVIPALENEDALRSLTRWHWHTGIPLAHDVDAYAISSSKLKSNRLFTQLGVPVPLSWPDCGVPVLAKPSTDSGSKGVKIFHSFNTLKDYFSPNFPPSDTVLQEYLPGSLHSIEIVGMPGQYYPFQVTDLYVDENYDCKRVVSPTELPDNLIADFENLSLTIANAINLHGIMDVEVVLHRGKLKVLEIDARLPSQTPTAVFGSTGQNMVQLLKDLFIDDLKETGGSNHRPAGTVYEHIRVCQDTLEVRGEHIMTGAGPLHLLQDFFGADEAITNFKSDKDQWIATLIISGIDRRSALTKKDRVVERILKRYSIKKVYDSIPAC